MFPAFHRWFQVPIIKYSHLKKCREQGTISKGLETSQKFYFYLTILFWESVKPNPLYQSHHWQLLHAVSEIDAHTWFERILPYNAFPVSFTVRNYSCDMQPSTRRNNTLMIKYAEIKKQAAALCGSILEFLLLMAVW